VVTGEACGRALLRPAAKAAVRKMLDSILRTTEGEIGEVNECVKENGRRDRKPYLYTEAEE
jgi:hypothetical protein